MGIRTADVLGNDNSKVSPFLCPVSEHKTWHEYLRIKFDKHTEGVPCENISLGFVDTYHHHLYTYKAKSVLLLLVSNTDSSPYILFWKFLLLVLGSTLSTLFLWFILLDLTSPSIHSYS